MISETTLLERALSIDLKIYLKLYYLMEVHNLKINVFNISKFRKVIIIPSAIWSAKNIEITPYICQN
jgi:hypothetical protein